MRVIAIEDYSNWVNLDFDFVDRVRNEGYESVFGEDAVKEFVESYAVYA